MKAQRCDDGETSLHIQTRKELSDESYKISAMDFCQLECPNIPDDALVSSLLRLKIVFA